MKSFPFFFIENWDAFLFCKALVKLKVKLLWQNNKIFSYLLKSIKMRWGSPKKIRTTPQINVGGLSCDTCNSLLK